MKKFKVILLTSFVIISYHFLIPSSIFADTLCPSGSPNGISTAIGCVPFDSVATFSGKVFRFSTGITGGVAIVMMIFAFFQLVTSSGDPIQIKSGKELLTSAISGLIMIIFSVFLLRLIGVQILGIL